MMKSLLFKKKQKSDFVILQNKYIYLQINGKTKKKSYIA
jgi:hypothetical protein